MSRVFLVKQDGGVKEYQEHDLPLLIGGGDKADIILPGQEQVLAYLADSRGHLFFQSAEHGPDIYHNNSRVSGSAWVKSQDQTLIGGHRIEYSIGPDLVELVVQEVASSSDRDIRDRSVATEPGGSGEKVPLPREYFAASGQKKGLKIKVFLFSFLCLLLLATGFILSAQSIRIVVSPEPDRLSLRGFPPAIPLGERFLALPGEYTVRVGKQGYLSLDETLVLADESLPVREYRLQKLPGRVQVTVTGPEIVKVYIDGQFLGNTPISEQSLSAGSHRLALDKERYKRLEQELVITGMGQLQEFAYTLDPAWAELTLESSPAGAQVLIADTVVGTTPCTLDLLEGEQHVILKKETYLSRDISFTLVAGNQYHPDPYLLQPAPAAIVVDTLPSGAGVVVDDTFVGKSPLTVEVAAGKSHTINIHLSGYKKAEQVVHLKAGETHTVTMQLQPEYGMVFVTSDPPDAELLVDGKIHGQATGKIRLQADREHLLKVTKKGFHPREKRVTPRKGHSVQLAFSLEPIQNKEGVGKGPGKNPPGFVLLVDKPLRITLGASRSEAGRRANEQHRQVSLSRPVYLSSHEVTNREYRRFNPEHRSGTIGDSTLDSDAQPVVQVSWEDAASYCNWLSAKEGLPLFYVEQGKTLVPVQPPNKGYRLPTEAEWTYAARMAGRVAMVKYPWDGPYPPSRKSVNLADESGTAILPVIIRGYNDGFAVTAPVTSFPANPVGLYDMGGNVSEWCHDLYNPYALIQQGKQQTNPLGPTSGTHRVIKGPSWRDATISELRFSYRGYSRSKSDDLGFRLARYTK